VPVKGGHCYLILAVVAALIALAGPAASPQDTVRYSFVYLGCNRLQDSDWKPMKETNPSSANVPQLQQTLADLAGLNPSPQFFFFVGDLVLNLEPDDGKTLQKQLDAWTLLYNASPPAGKIPLIPLPGNHEMLQQVNGNEVPNAATDPVWLSWLKENHLDGYAGNGPTPAGTNADLLVDDQSALTYSFDRGDMHFVLLSTDTLNQPDQAGWIATNWIANDLQQAQQNPDTTAIFVLGHKPIVPPKDATDDADGILNTTPYPLAQRLQQLLQQTPKVKAYLCAHAHEWSATQLGGAGGAWQVVAGNGGSQLEHSWNPPGGPFYGFTLVKLYTSGQVSVTSFQRPVPDPYFAADPLPSPAQPQPEMFLPR
jgi:hypothetical protein